MNTVSPWTRLAFTVTFMAILSVVSLIPGRAQPGDSVFVWLVASTPTLLQKILHLLLYAVLTLLWAWTLESIESKLLRLGIAVSIAVCFGAAMEWYQTKIPGRFGTIFDVALNAVGALIGVLTAIFLF
jgi:VanZ family protein